MPSAERRRALIASVLALGVALLYQAYLSPGRLDTFFDQHDYLALADVLASKGLFARAIGDGIVPEARRAIGYPLFLAGLAKVFGSPHPAAIWIQALFVATLPVLAYVFARAVLGAGAAFAAALGTALYLPFGYWAAYTMTETLATVLVTGGTVALYVALRDGSWPRAVLAGVCLGCVGLVRPTLAFTAVALVLGALVVAQGRGAWATLRVSAVIALIAIAVGVVPQVAYVRENFNRTALTPYPPGLQMLLGYWQGVWPGRVSSHLGALAEERAAPERVATAARELGIEPSQAVRYVTQLVGYGDRFDSYPDGFIRANDWAFEEALNDIRADVGGWIARGVTARVPLLLAGSIPVRYEVINSLPRPAILLLWAAQGLIVALALVGILALLLRGGRGRPVGALALALLLYVSAVHFPMWIDPRYGLPAQPLIIVAAVAGAVELLGRIRTWQSPVRLLLRALRRAAR